MPENLAPRVLHIGQRKTGTTWLQQTAEDAARAGVLTYEHWDLTAALKGATWKTITDAQLTDAFATLPCDTPLPCLASCEDLMVHDFPRLAMALGHVWPTAKVLVTTRSPQGYLTSSFNNDSFTKGQPAAEFTRRFSLHHMPRVFDLNGAATAFGPQKTHFLPYELLRADPATYLDQISTLLNVDLSPYAPQSALNVSPPPTFLILQRKINAMIETQAPEILKTPEWAQFKLMANFSAGSADGLGQFFDRFFAENPVADSDMPQLPDDILAVLSSQMTVLQDAPLYHDFLPLYGLPAATAS
ncbi:hypothetical protein C1J03_19525 [Sulfitobacter sp. SK012]|uniref:hypothetical protein n=1 Tax=Sulfitobacter sp. SK012 TaxID=1389005 RepID=UPI000E0AB463|nr:hypothetical protein [Sulfitobacter sp. SK012]AXI47997.1 hypothetical protein C1J03_19525 [Sulfitobacter sp. SK012]